MSREEVLPAYAGMIHGSEPGYPSSARAPRVCGDDPSARSSVACARRCSPRMRG